MVIVALIVGQLLTHGLAANPPKQAACGSHWFVVTDGPIIYPGDITINNHDVLARIRVSSFDLDASAKRLAPVNGYQGDGEIDVQLDGISLLSFDNRGHGLDNEFAIGFKGLPTGFHYLRVSIISVTGRVLGYISSCFKLPANQSISKNDFKVP
jgi:hypothetical protein